MTERSVLATLLAGLAMLVRIRWDKRHSAAAPRFQSAALVIASLLTPSALLAFTMAFWRVAADLRWTNTFALSEGLYSHWQTWVMTAAVLLLVARLLGKYAQSEEQMGPKRKGRRWAPRVTEAALDSSRGALDAAPVLREVS